MGTERGAAWLYAAGIGLIFAVGTAIDAALTMAYGPYPIIHVTASPWLWGAGPVAGWPAWLPLIGAAFGAALAAYGASVSGWDRLAVWLRVRRRAILAVGAVAALGIFWYWRVAASGGDVFKYMVMLRDDRWFVMSQPLSTALFSLGYGVLGPLGWPPAAAAAIVNALAGVVWVVAAEGLIREAHVSARPVVIAGALLAGGAVMFFGYIETMAWPLALATWYGLAARRALAGHSPWSVALLFGLSVASHGQMLLLGPSLLVVAFSVLRRRGWLSTAAFAVLSALPIALVVGVALLNQGHIYDTLVGDILGGGDRRMFVPLTALTSMAERYTLLSVWQLWELANLVLRAGPWLFVLVFGAWVGLQRGRRDSQRVFWALVFAGSVAFIVLWNPDFGMNTDWDLYAPPVMLALLSSAMLWPEDWRLQPMEGGAAAGLSLGAAALTLLTFMPTASFDPWNADALLSGRPVYARFGEVAELVSVKAPAGSAQPGQPWTVTLTWRLRQSTTTQYTAAVHVVAHGPAGPELVAQHDARPVAPIDWPNPRFTDEWCVGELVPDVHEVPIPLDAAAGEYEVWAVWYDLATGQRLPAGADDHVVIATLEIAPP